MTGKIVNNDILICMYTVFVVIFYSFLVKPIYAQQNGANWEFKEDGNFEGWGVGRYLDDFSVSDGMMTGTMTSLGAIVGSSFSGPEIDLSAGNFGYVYIRMQTLGATSGTVTWRNSIDEIGGINFDVVNDSLFHIYELQVNAHSDWTGQIVKFENIVIKGMAGTEIKIDYIRIVSVGPKFRVSFFKPLRTVLKKDDKIPFIAKVENAGDRSGSATAKLVLTHEFNIISNNSEIPLNEWDVLDSDTLKWTIESHVAGDYQFKLQLTWNDSSQSEASFQMPIADQYWKNDGLVVSTWGAPEQTEDGISEYLDAHFNTIVRIAADESQVEFFASHGLKCMIDLFGTLGGTPYLRGFDREPPYEMTEEILAQADPIIEKFKTNPAVIGYHICDEPCTNAFENLGMVVSYLREKDPTRLSYINLYPSYGNNMHFQGYSYEDHVARFMDVVRPELLSYDHYNFLKLEDREDYFFNLQVIRKNACLYDIPFCNIIQGQSVTNDTWRTPTKEEFRLLNYSTLAYGGKWIVYFYWPHMKLDPLFDSVIYSSVQQLNQEVIALSPVLSKLRSEAVYHTYTIPLGCTKLPANTLVKSVSDNADFIVGLMKDSTDSDYIMLMNKSTYSQVTKTVTLNRKVESLSCFDVSSGGWQNIPFENIPTGAEFSSTFEPGGGKLFKVGEATSVVDNDFSNPKHFQLYQNYPNPFNPTTSICYSLYTQGHVELKVFNILGEEVASLVNQIQNAGEHRVLFDASNFTNGVYFYQLKTSDQTCSRKLLIVK